MNLLRPLSTTAVAVVLLAGLSACGGNDSAPSRGPRAFGGAFGEVTAVTPDGFTVQSVRPGSSEAQTQ